MPGMTFPLFFFTLLNEVKLGTVYPTCLASTCLPRIAVFLPFFHQPINKACPLSLVLMGMGPKSAYPPVPGPGSGTDAFHKKVSE